MRKISLLTALVSIFCLWGLTQSNAEDESVDLNKIVVTPSRIEQTLSDTPSKVDIINAKEIQSSATGDLTEPLTQLTGVNISDYGGLGSERKIRMRGSTAAQVMVLVDGRPINSPRDGEIDLSTLAFNNIERIEVVHGPGSSLYGSSAMGGTVNILTKNPPKYGQKTEVFSSYGTFGTVNESINHGARIGNFGYLLNSEYQHTHGHRWNSESDAQDINTKLEYTLNDYNTLGLNSGAFKSRTGAPGYISSPDDDTQDISKNFADLNWTSRIDESLSLSTKAYNNHDRLEFLENTTDGYTAENKKDVHTTVSRGFDSQISKKFTDELQGTYGFNYVTNLNNSTTTDKHKYIIRAGYMDNQMELFNRLKLNLGARIDDYSNFGTQTNPSFGAVYILNENNRIRSSIARSFRAPTFNDLYWPNDGVYNGNPNLKPEKGITKEIGIDTRLHKNLNTSITYFRNDFTNLINWAQDGTLYTPKNVDKARMDGIELENKLYLSHNFDLNLNYSFLKAIDKYTKKDLVYQPRNKVDAALKYHDINGFAGEFTGQFTSRRYVDTANTDAVKKFYIFNFNLSKKINNSITGYLWLKNITNRKYEVISEHPACGFSVTGGIKKTF